MKIKHPFLMAALFVGLGLIPAIRMTAQTFTTLYNFTLFSTYPDAAMPVAGLILSDRTLYGTAQWGGYSFAGAVFKVNTDGTGFTALHSFWDASSNFFPQATNADGAIPVAGLILSDNTLYGTAQYGGNSGAGTVFKVNTDGTAFKTLHSFTALTRAFTDIDGAHDTNSDGAYPHAELVLSGNTLYGTTVAGGGSGHGTVFKTDTDGTGFTTLHHFTAWSFPYYTNSDGINPVGGLVLSGNTLYGTALQGGNSRQGTVFAVNTDGTGFTTLHHFAGSPSDGALPVAGLILSGNTLYGATEGGGSLGYGTVFAGNTDGTGFTTLHDFTSISWCSGCVNSNSDGALPVAGLILSGNSLYGTTKSGGNSGNGTVFAVNTDGAGFTTLHHFAGSPADGAVPYGGLVLSGKTLYGTTGGGGTSDYGTVFKLLLNHAPSSVANVAPLFSIPPRGANRFILSPNNAAATVLLDGSQSSDTDDDPLQFSWTADGQATVLATDAGATDLFAVGPHTVQLEVSDGYDTATAQVSFEVITPAVAVGQLIRLVDDANIGSRNKQPLLASLRAAMSSFDRGDVRAAVNQLSVFQRKVLVQLAPSNPVLANEFAAVSQQIITVVSGR